MNELNNKILKQAEKLNYTVAEIAPNNVIDLFNSSSLKVWSGQSDNTIWNDPKVNWAFRALHDQLHLDTGIGFSPDQEMYIGRLQASQYDGMLADLVYIETTEQAKYFKENGVFVSNQKLFTVEKLKLIA